MRSDLLAAPIHINQWLPDETLFSLCSRVHHALGHARPDNTCQVLFGHTQRGSSHDIPVRVDEFTSRTHASLGDSDTTIWSRTILPFYLRLADLHQVENALAIARSSSLGNLKARLGILASRFGASHPLKACPDCMIEDGQIHHVSYWHRDHQWPGTWICTKHHQQLLRGIGKVSTRGRFQWFLPNEMRLVQGVDPADFAAAAPLLIRLADSAVAFGAGTEVSRFSSHLLAQTYRRQLARASIISPSGRISTKDLEFLLESSLKPVSRVFGFETLGQDQASLYAQFSRLLQESRSTAHPLRHLLFISVIFDSWSQFVEAYRASALVPFQGDDEPVCELGNKDVRTIEDQHRQQLYSLVHGGMSASAAASSMGVATATAMAWLAASGTITPRRPKTLTPALRGMAIDRLRRGVAKDTIAAAIGMSIQTVTLLLRTEPGLHTAWRTARFQKAQRIARARWERTASRLSSPSPKAMRDIQPAVFAWLYRNDRAWLVSFSQALPRLSRSNNVRIRWDERDVQISRDVRREAEAFASSHDQKRPRLSDLCDAIESLRRKLGSLDQLPLTRTAIREVIRGRLD